MNWQDENLNKSKYFNEIQILTFYEFIKIEPV
jgi:hypothetical protein